MAEKFKKKYDREIISKNIGQFHSNFEPINGHDETPHPIESIFIAKKIYMDKLTDSTGDIWYHLRGNGIAQQSIKAITNEKYNEDYVKTYEVLYNNETLTFDLTKEQPYFMMNNHFTVSSKKEFLRRIKTVLSEGKPEDYFIYVQHS